jgi:hypothetical protein
MMFSFAKYVFLHFECTTYYIANQIENENEKIFQDCYCGSIGVAARMLLL